MCGSGVDVASSLLLISAILMAVGEQPFHLSRCPNFRNRLRLRTPFAGEYGHPAFHPFPLECLTGQTPRRNHQFPSADTMGRATRPSNRVQECRSQLGVSQVRSSEVAVDLL